MANDLIKEKKIKTYVAGTAADPGFPGQLAQPRRVIKDTYNARVTAAASTMSIDFLRVSLDSGDSVIVGVTWTSPLDALRIMVGRPNLGASTAHYSERLGPYSVKYGSLTRTALESMGYTLGALRIPVEWTDAWIMDRITKITIIPAKPAIPARPPKAATPPRITYDYQLGWLGVARSVRVLPAGWIGQVTFEVGAVVGAIVGFITKPSGEKLAENGLNPVRSGVAIGDGYVSIVQEGSRYSSVSLPATSSVSIKAVVTGAGVEWMSNDQFIARTPLNSSDELVLYASLYRGDDAVLNPVITDGVPPEPMDPATGKAKLYLRAMKVLSKVPSVGALQLRPVALLGSSFKVAQGDARLGAVRITNTPLPRGQAGIPAARVRASDIRRDGFGLSVLQRLQIDAIMMREDWVPKYSMGTAFVPPLTVSGIVRGGQSAQVEMQLPALISAASEREHAEGRAAMRAPMVGAEGEILTNLVKCMNVVGQYVATDERIYLSIVIAERAGVQSPVVAATVIAVDAYSRVGVESVVELSATIIEQAMEQIGSSLKHTALLFRLQGDKIIPVEQGSAWAVNTATNASTRYEGYAFNSFMSVGGKHFGVQPRGVYLLEGTDDAGLPIAAGVSLGKQDFGSQALKGLSAVHAGVSAKGTLFLRVGDGKSTWTYRARRVDDRMRTQRFDPGKGIRTNYFDFELVSEGEFELDSVKFEVVASQRRI